MSATFRGRMSASVGTFGSVPRYASEIPADPPLYRPPQPGPDLPIDPPVAPVSDPPVLPPDDPGNPMPVPGPITL